MTTTVSQEAREAAAALIEAQYERQGIPKTSLQTPGETRIGDRDHCIEVQAFAKFEQSIRQSAERGEVVAWMYEDEHGSREWFSDRWPELAAKGWTEHALYTLPTPPEAV